MTAPPALVDHFFRHEYGRLVAVLVKRVGVLHLDLVEDAVQSALEAALHAWAARGVPENPRAWLFRVAHNELFGALRTQERRQRLLDAAVVEQDAEATDPAFAGEVSDELLRMLFVCCDDRLPPESRLALALRTLCGFGTGEIAQRLFTSEANVTKRLTRARAKLRELAVETTPTPKELRARIASVQAVLYSLFNEGYLSVRAEDSIREELCDEAIRLGEVLAAHPVGAVPSVFALLALMHLHRARLSSRRDATGGLLLLEEQDRSRWDRAHLSAGASWLERAAAGEQLSRFHIEAGIAAQHAFAPSFAETRWERIAELYALLEHVDPSPLHRLNRAIATAEYAGPEAGLALLAEDEPPAWLAKHYSRHAVLADLHRRAGDEASARVHRERALADAPTPAVRALLARRLRLP